jgi:hypothetical protein
LGALRFDRRFILVLLIGVLAVDAIVLAVGHATGFRRFGREDGPLEIVQLVVLGLSAVGFGSLVFRLHHAARLVAAGAASLCIMFFFREFEIPVKHPVVLFIASDRFLYLLAAVLGVFLAVEFWRNRSHVPALVGWLIRIEWWPFLVAGLLLVAGEQFEKAHLRVTEEMLELSGFLVLAIVAAAVWYRTLARSRIGMMRPA